MNQCFKSANLCPSSSMTEVEFKNIKTLLFQNRRGIRVDTFVRSHIEYLNGRVLIELGENKSLNHGNGLEANISNDSEGELNTFGKIDELLEEDWRGKNVDIIANANKFKTVKRCRTSILNPHRPASKIVPILKNGNKTICRKKTKTPSTLTTRTCAFDSIFQVFATCYFEIPAFQEVVKSDGSTFCKLITTALDLEKITESYKLRDEILFELFPEHVIFSNMIKIIDCKMSVATMFMRLCEHFKILNSLQEFKYCHGCNVSSKKVFKAFVPTNLNDLNMEELQESIRQTATSKSICSDCRSSPDRLTVCRQYNEIVVFDIEKSQTDNTYMIDIEEISGHIYLQDKKYNLKAVVEGIDQIEHFIAHVRRNDNKWETMDDIHTRTVSKPAAQIHPILLFYCASVENVLNQDVNMEHSLDTDISKGDGMAFNGNSAMDSQLDCKSANGNILKRMYCNMHACG